MNLTMIAKEIKFTVIFLIKKIQKVNKMLILFIVIIKKMRQYNLVALEKKYCPHGRIYSGSKKTAVKTEDTVV